MKIKDIAGLLDKIGEIEVNLQSEKHLEPDNFKVSSKGWKLKKSGGLRYKINPSGDITEYVSGVDKNLVGEQLFTWDAAVRETKKAGKRMPTDEKWSDLEKKLLQHQPPLAGYRTTDGSYYGRGTVAALWSSSPDGGDAWSRSLGVSGADVYRDTDDKALGFSVRCLSD